MTTTIESGFRLSPQQREMWARCQSDPAGVFRTRAAIQISGPLDTTALLNALCTTVQRHEILRTSFPPFAGLALPMQVIHTGGGLLVTVESPAQSGAAGWEAAVARQFAAWREQPFDLASGPLLRAALLAQGEREHLLVLEASVLCSDAIALDELLREAIQRYSTPGSAADEPLQYADAAEWLNGVLASDDGEGASFWRQATDSAAPAVRLPFERPQEGPQLYAPAWVAVPLDSAAQALLPQRAAQLGVSEEALLLACWAMLLQQHLGHPELQLGVLSHGRAVAELQRAIGLFARVLPARLSVASDASFAALAAQAQTALEQTRAWHEFWPADGTGQEHALGFEWYSWERLPDAGTAHFKVVQRSIALDDARLKLLGQREGDSLAAAIHYDAGYLTADDVHSLAAVYAALLAQALDQPELAIEHYYALPPRERERVLVDFNQAAAPYERTRSVQRVFEAIVARQPDQPAVVYEGQQLSYAELNARANQLARLIRQYGVGRDTCVGLYLERSLDMLVSMMAVLKAGGAYVPIDPAYPAERAAFMLSHAQVPLVLTHAALAATLPAGTAHVLDLAAEGARIARESPANLAEDSDPAALAYVIYTSGSTGQPKGVMIEHAAIHNLVSGLHQLIYADCGPQQPVALIASYAFDASVQQIFAALLQGHTLYIVPEIARRDGAALQAYLRRHAIAICDGTPATLYLLLAATDGAELPVKHFIIGGEELPVALAPQFYARYGHRTLITNIYGPAECCVDATAYLLHPAELPRLTTVPIGRPMANRRVYILDAQRRPVPVGVTGEIYIGGVGVGRGYLYRPDLTAERFGPDLQNPAGTMYRTGDLGRWRRDGAIEFVGRSDDQVKIRGFRVELGEIEAALRELPQIRDCVVTLRQRDETAAAPRSCRACFLSSNMPHVTIDDDGLCNVCRAYAQSREQLAHYFKTPDDLLRIRDQVRRQVDAEYDCLLLYSGGKDSTYALYQLVRLGFRVLTYTFDNGYISPAAFENITRVCQQLGVDNIRGSLPAMRAIFAESLRTDSSVCTGCFRALTSHSTRLAMNRRIPLVVTALSRGQIYETKLAVFMQQQIFAVEQIERDLLGYRKLYHSSNDRLGALIRDDLLADEAAFDRIHFLDFFRYVDVRDEEILATLRAHDLGWVMPEDTGSSSSNCLINDVGVHVHLREKGYHYYANQFSWEVRIGHRSYEQARAELVDTIDAEHLSRTLAEIEYAPPAPESALPDARLYAYVVATAGTTQSQLREALAARFPEYMLPAAFVFCDSFPLTVHGKIDRRALPDPDGERPQLGVAYVAPRSDEERSLVAIWQEVLGYRQIGVEDSFFELGGHSLLATQLVGRIRQAFQIELPLRALFAHPTVARLAPQVVAQLSAKLASTIDAISDAEVDRMLHAMAQQAPDAQAAIHGAASTTIREH